MGFRGDTSGGEVPASEVKFGWRYLGRIIEGEEDKTRNINWKIKHEGHKGAKGIDRGKFIYIFL